MGVRRWVRRRSSIADIQRPEHPLALSTPMSVRLVPTEAVLMAQHEQGAQIGVEVAPLDRAAYCLAGCRGRRPHAPSAWRTARQHAVTDAARLLAGLPEPSTICREPTQGRPCAPPAPPPAAPLTAPKLGGIRTLRDVAEGRVTAVQQMSSIGVQPRHALADLHVGTEAARRRVRSNTSTKRGEGAGSRSAMSERVPCCSLRAGTTTLKSTVVASNRVGLQCRRGGDAGGSR